MESEDYGMFEAEYDYIGSCATCGEDLGSPWATKTCE